MAVESKKQRALATCLKKGPLPKRPYATRAMHKCPGNTNRKEIVPYLHFKHTIGSKNKMLCAIMPKTLLDVSVDVTNLYMSWLRPLSIDHVAI
eukprot:2919674-Amphidinium_carterae.1